MKEEGFKGYVYNMVFNMIKDFVGVIKILDWIFKVDWKIYVYGYMDLLKIDVRFGLEKIKVECFILVVFELYGEDMVLKNINS